jgi:hypothetical protein
MIWGLMHGNEMGQVSVLVEDVLRNKCFHRFVYHVLCPFVTCLLTVLSYIHISYSIDPELCKNDCRLWNK